MSRADVKAGTPMPPETRMLAASIGKSFVAATVVALESDGLLARSDFVAKHLGEMPWFDRLPNHDTMTVGDLLRHSAGLPDHVHTVAFAAEMSERVRTGGDANSPEAAIAFVFDTEPLFEAGAGWAYSDTGYLLLGLVIEAATRIPYYTIVAERFLIPLGLTQTSPSNQRALPNLAAGYTVENNRFGLPPRTMGSSGRLVWDPAIEWTGGGLISTARDLAHWGHALFSGRALTEPNLDRLLDRVRTAPDNSRVRYGPGVSIRSETSHGPVYGHGGWIPGYVSSLRHYADHDVTIAFQINTDVGIVDDSTDLVSLLEGTLADLILTWTSTMSSTANAAPNDRTEAIE